MNSASFDLSISALVLILDISSLTIRQNQVVMQVVNWPHVASPQTSHGVCSSHIHFFGEEMNAWQMNPAGRLRGG